MNELEEDLVGFARWVLDSMQQNDEWDSDLLEGIAHEAMKRNVAGDSKNGYFEVTERVGIPGRINDPEEEEEAVEGVYQEYLCRVLLQACRSGEMADTAGSEPAARYGRPGSSPGIGTNNVWMVRRVLTLA